MIKSQVKVLIEINKYQIWSILTITDPVKLEWKMKEKNKMMNQKYIKGSKKQNYKSIIFIFNTEAMVYFWKQNKLTIQS